MEEWLKVFEHNESLSAFLLLAAFVLGLLGTFASCINFAIIAAIAGYSGTLDLKNNKRKLIFINFSLFFGIFISFLVIGLITNLAGQKIADSIGPYWKLFAGIMSIFAGVVSIGLIHIKTPNIQVKKEGTKTGFIPTLIFGLTIGGASVACAACCNPVFPVILGATFLQHTITGSILVLLSFSIGYSLPYMVALTGLGLSLETMNKKISVLNKYLKYITGGILIIVGFYFLLSF